jgi:hypothetical protein
MFLKLKFYREGGVFPLKSTKALLAFTLLNH